MRKYDPTPCALCLLVYFLSYSTKQQGKITKLDFLTTTLLQAVNQAFRFFASKPFTSFQSYDTSRGILCDVNKIEC